MTTTNQMFKIYDGTEVSLPAEQQKRHMIRLYMANPPKPGSTLHEGGLDYHVHFIETPPGASTRSRRKYVYVTCLGESVGV